MNVVVISGGLGKDPEVRKTQGGSTIMNFSVAVSDRRKNNQTGQWEETTHWIDCVMFGKRAESLSRFLKKGMKVTVSGRLQQNRWEDKKSGQKRSKVEVVANDVVLPPKGSGSDSQRSERQYGPQNGSQGFSDAYQGPEMYSSDIPFSYPTLG